MEGGKEGGQRRERRRGRGDRTPRADPQVQTDAAEVGLVMWEVKMATRQAPPATLHTGP